MHPWPGTLGRAPSQTLSGCVVDGDAIVIFEFGEGSLARLEADPLWANLPAVRAGRVVTLTSDESNAGFFDSALTVPLNLVTIERVIGAVGP